MTQEGTCTPFLTATLFTTAKAWRQLKHTPTGERIRKLWHIHNITYILHIHAILLAITKNEITPPAQTSMGLEIVMLSETKSDGEGEIQYDTPYMWNLQRNDTNELLTKQKGTNRPRKQTFFFAREKISQ